MHHEESYLEMLRRKIEEQYIAHDGNGDFGVILCRELHTNELHFKALAEKWGINLATLGLLIADHCNRLQEFPVIKFHADL